MDGPTIERVIEEADRRAERLIGWMRISVALALGVVFAAFVVGASPPDDPIILAQLMLARLTLVTCLVIGVAALVVSTKRLYRPLYAYVFVAADVGFVLMSLSIALGNTNTAPAFAPLLPSMWLVPLILALNALRYRAGVQAFGGALLVVGLVTLGFLEPPPAAFPTTNLMQTPPNVMRLAMITAASAVLFLAVRRARGTLARAVAEERGRREIGRYLPPQVASLIAGGDEAITGGRRQEVVVLFVDIRAFTARSEAAAPEAVSAFLATYRTLIVEAANACGAIVDKFVGDGALLVFGIPEPREDDRAKALLCASTILGAVEAWSARRVAAGEDGVAIGIGVHAGEAFVGALESAGRLEFTVLGDAVNVAARLEEATKKFQASALASAAVVAGVDAKALGVALENVGPVMLRGRSERVAAFAIAPPREL
ncbi:MAG: adenylate/guanylate cyclase domain-containing protein [Pseudomonadota bacterium]